MQVIYTVIKSICVHGDSNMLPLCYNGYEFLRYMTEYSDSSGQDHNNTGADIQLSSPGYFSTLIIVIYALQNDELIAAAGSAGDVMQVVSLLNSGADIQTKDRVCYIITTEKFTFSMVIDDLCTVDTNYAV